MRVLATLSLLAFTPMLTAQEPNKPAENTAVPSDFVRFVAVGDGGHLDTAITTYRNRDGVEVTLLGAVHIADPSHYQALQQRFATFEALLYELVGPEDYRPRPGDPRSRAGFVSILQNLLKSGLELQFQLDAIDYSPANFVHADMTAREFQETMDARGESLLSLMWQAMVNNMNQLKERADGEPAPAGGNFDLVAAFRSGEGRHQMRMLFAQQLEDLEAIAFGGKDGSTLLEGRNDKCLQVLQQQIKAGRKKLGIYYGAAHFPHMEKRLVEDLGFSKTGHEWLLAWDCSKRPDPKFDKVTFARRQQARKELGELAEAARSWRLEHSKLPALADLLAKGEDGKPAYAGSSVDPWGKDYLLRARGTRIEALSGGPDGEVGNKDDIVVQEPRRSSAGEGGGLLDRVRAAQDEAKLQKAQTDVVIIAETARLYRVRNGRLPTLADLVTPDQNGYVYLEGSTKDPWENDYVLRAGAGPGDFAVLSAGPDGKLDTGDDVSSVKR